MHHDGQGVERLPARGTRRRWLPIVAAAIPLVVLIVWLARLAAPTRIDGIVDHAIAVERALPQQPEPSARVRLAPTSEAPVFKSWTGSLDARRELPRAVETLLARYGDPATPLRAESYRRWRETLDERREIVIGQGDRLVLRTWTDADALLRGVELVVHADTHRVVAVFLLGPGYRVELEPVTGPAGTARPE